MHKWLLGGVIILAFLLRIVGLSNHPAGFTPDEASFGYDAYSLLETGRDQWGKPWPIVLESFGDFKMPLYTYLSLPTVALFGLNEFAVRLPNVLFGTLAILATYFLTKKAFDSKVALLASFLLTVSPWHIAMSRGAFEANLTTFLLPISLFFFFKAKENSKFLILSAVFASLNLFSYHSARLITPLLFGLLLLINFKSIKKDRHLWIAGSISLVVLVFVLISFAEGAGARVASSGIFSLTTDQRYWATMAGSPDIVSRFFYNKATFLTALFFKNYLSYFSPQFLFTQGPAETTYGMLSGRGVLYLSEVIFFIGFLIYLFKKGVKNILWLLVWIVLAPIPASLTIGPGYAANRAVIMLPALTIALALGAQMIRNKNFYKLTIGIVGLSAIFYLHAYWFLQPTYGAPGMIYGAREVITYMETNKQNFNQLIISKKLSEPHIYVAFYNRLDPNIYQQQSTSWNYKDRELGWVDQLPEYSLGDYQFKSLDWQYELNSTGKKLIAGLPEEFPSNVVPLLVIYYPNGKPAYYIVDTTKTDYAHLN